MRQFYGKYRGKVVNNIDPLQAGRIQVVVPAVQGAGQPSWALPCVPYAGKDVGFFALPPMDANVWVEFEGGDPDYPIWTGSFWGKGDLPAEANTPATKLFKTEDVTLKIVDLPGAASFSVETSAGLKIEIGPDTITLDNGQGGTVILSADTFEFNAG